MSSSSSSSSSNNDDTNNAKNSSAIRQYPIQSIAADSWIDQSLAEALLASMDAYYDQLQGRRIWLACSGGRDSLALAALCLQLYRQGDLPFLPQLLHVNHGLQADSDNWAQHVSQWAQAQQMPCHILRATVNGHDEQAARQARYQVMFSHINHDDVLLLAHHADDQAETVLIRLIQGAGVNGLSGMQAWREHRQGARQHILWRPWLTVRRTAITTYAEQLKLPYINDPTNDDGDNVRSGLRRDIMPLLANYNANVVHNIARSAQLLADAHATVSTQAAQDSQYTAISPLCQPPFQRVLDIDKLQSLPLHRQRQLLHYWLAQDEPLPPAKQLIDDVLALTQRTDANHQTTLDWYASTQIYTIRRYRQQLYRLSHSFLKWLTLAITEQTLTLSSNHLSNDVTKNQIETIILRSNEHFCWQLQFTPHTIARLFTSLLNRHQIDQNLSSDGIDLFKGEAAFLLKIAPLGRQQRLQTVLATRPQAGKKLTQTLAMPVWLRDSLVVISIVSIHTNEELPLLLTSPFDSWILGFDKSTAGITSTILNSDFSFITTVRTTTQCHQDDSK